VICEKFLGKITATISLDNSI